MRPSFGVFDRVVTHRFGNWVIGSERLQMAKRWKNRPDGSNWGDFGDDDQIGRLNLLTPERVRRAATEIQTGERFCLSLPLDYPGGNKLNPRRHPPRRFATDRSGVANYKFEMSDEGADWFDITCDDAVLLYTQYSSQWDAFTHWGAHFDADGDGVAERLFYNGWSADTHLVKPDPQTAGDPMPHEGCEAQVLGIDTFAKAAIQGRGVLVDLSSRFGRDRHYVTYDDLKGILDDDDVSIETGDMVCFYTGFGDVVMKQNRDPDPDVLHSSCAVLDGRDEKLRQWVSETGAAALISDNYAVEGYPAREGEGKHSALPLHNHCLFKLGVPLGELWYLSDLAAWLKQAGRNRFFLTAPPLRLPGAVGSPVTAVATV